MRFHFFFLILILSFGCCIQPPETEMPSAQADGTPDIVEYEHVEIDDEPTVSPSQPTVTGLKSEEIMYYSGGWDIYATMYPAQSTTPTRVIVLVPMLGEDRTSYPRTFIERLHDELPEAIVLAIDPRGHGESTNLGTYNNFDKYQFKDMQNDIIDSKKYFPPKYPTVREYYVIGASIGSTSAIYAGARDRDITKIVMISPGMEYREVSIERPADDYQFQLLLAAASGDRYSADAVDEIESISSSQVTKKIFSGSAHGTDLFDATEYETESLSDAILKFLKK